MRKVFLDVGAHAGQTLQAVKRWDFDTIICLEPVAEHIPTLLKMADARTVVTRCGLLDVTCVAPLFNAGTQGASLWKRPDRPTNSEMCHFYRASAWLQDNLRDDDRVWMKINTEGAELAILTDLLDSGEFSRIGHLLIMWDAGKIPQLADGVAPVRERLAQYGSPRVVHSKEITAPTCNDRFDKWLAMTPGVSLL